MAVGVGIQPRTYPRAREALAASLVGDPIVLYAVKRHIQEPKVAPTAQFVNAGQQIRGRQSGEKGQRGWC